MTVTLSPRIARYAEAQVKAGIHATPDEAINRIVEEQLAEEERACGEIEAALLLAVEEPTIPYREGEFVDMIKQKGGGSETPATQYLEGQAFNNESVSMTVVLNAHTEAIVAEHLKRGQYSTPDEVVNALLAREEDDRGLSYEEAEAELLSTLGKPLHPYREGEFWTMINEKLAREREA